MTSTAESLHRDSITVSTEVIDLRPSLFIKSLRKVSHMSLQIKPLDLGRNWGARKNRVSFTKKNKYEGS